MDVQENQLGAEPLREASGIAHRRERRAREVGGRQDPSDPHVQCARWRRDAAPRRPVPKTSLRDMRAGAFTKRGARTS
jgi:hypothetical protein